MKLSCLIQNTHIEQSICDFVTSCNLGSDLEISHIPQDASKRIYYRVTLGNGQSYIIMNTYHEPSVAEKFIEIGAYLQKIGLRTPQIKMYDSNVSLMLIEDFGANSFSQVLSSDISQEQDLYHRAIEVLSHIASINHEIQLPIYCNTLLHQELLLFSQHFLPLQLAGNILDTATSSLISIFDQLFNNLGQLRNVLVLRDYHVDNLMLLNAQDSKASVGLLDFQDAVLGSPAYDLVSLLEDARRDVTHKAMQSSKELYMRLTPIADQHAFEYEYAVLGMQRNLKIIGIFTKLCTTGRGQYKRYLPRVFGYVANGLRNPIMYDLAQWFNQYKIQLHI